MFLSNTYFHWPYFFLSATQLAPIPRHNCLDHMALLVVVSRLSLIFLLRSIHFCPHHPLPSHSGFFFSLHFLLKKILQKALFYKNPLEEELISFLSKIKGESSLKLIDLYTFLNSSVSRKRWNFFLLIVICNANRFLNSLSGGWKRICFQRNHVILKTFMITLIWRNILVWPFLKEKGYKVSSFWFFIVFENLFKKRRLLKTQSSYNGRVLTLNNNSVFSTWLQWNLWSFEGMKSTATS